MNEFFQGKDGNIKGNSLDEDPNGLLKLVVHPENYGNPAQIYARGRPGIYYKPWL